CGHDAHMTWGLAALEAIAESDFAGRLVVFFQPAEETGGGGRPGRRRPDCEAARRANDHTTPTTTQRHGNA
ncbi:hypothetical protein DJ71_26135, partial [Halorubrum sp. E3]